MYVCAGGAHWVRFILKVTESKDIADGVGGHCLLPNWTPVDPKTAWRRVRGSWCVHYSGAWGGEQGDVGIIGTFGTGLSRACTRGLFALHLGHDSCRSKMSRCDE